MALAAYSTYNGLLVCDKCGWPMAGMYEEQQHKSACPYVIIGKSASTLAERVDEIASTKLGSGTGQLTFELDKHLTVQLSCNKDGTFHLRELWLLDDLTADDAADLVRTIAAWRRDCKNMRRR